MADTLRIHQLVPLSYANGPGARAVIWVQGCTLGCEGCFNTEAQPRAGGEVKTIDELCSWLFNRADIEGVTISGGEPLQQLPQLLTLLERIRRESQLSVLLFTGHEMAELEALPDYAQLCVLCDVVICGRYQQGLRLAHGLIGSSNQEIVCLSERYSEADLEVPVAEVIIGTDGTLTFSGIDPMVTT